MTVSSYETKENKTFWKVYVNLRSKVDPKIRVQREERKIESKGSATRRERELIEICLREIIQREGSQPTFGEIVESWEICRRECGDIQEITIDDYLSAIKIWCDSILPKSASDINKADIRKIMTTLSESGKSNGYQSKILNLLNRIYTWGKEEGLIKGGANSITAGIKVKKINKKAPEILTLEEIKKLLLEAKLQNNPWYPIWAAAIFTGMRNSEIYSITWSDVDFSNNLLMVTKSYNKRKNTTGPTKGSYDRTVPINGSLRELLLELKNTSTTNEVFPRIRNWGMGLQAYDLRLFCVQIGIRSVKFHTLRACFATHLLFQGASVVSVMKIGGWGGLKTMDIYVRRAGVGEKGATDCLDQFAPGNINENVIAFKA